MALGDVWSWSNLPGLFFVHFKENIDYWIGLLGGLARTALHAFHGGIDVWDVATVNSAEAYNGDVILRKKRDTIGEVTRYESAT